MKVTRWRRLGITAALIGLTAGSQLLMADSAHAAAGSIASANVSCYALAGPQGTVGCRTVYGDIAETITGIRSGNTMKLSWMWNMDTSRVKNFRVGAFVFSAGDCTRNQWFWTKDYSYAKGTSLRHASGTATVGLVPGHRYAVTVRAYGTYDRKFPNGSVATSYIGTGGPGGQAHSLGACV